MIAPNQKVTPALGTPVTHRFLSPHYDDIALSCGGSAALLARSGATPEIRVAFGAEPDPAQELSPFANEQHRRWGFAASQVISERRREEAAAADLLGATSSSLSLCDAIYRGTSYQSDDQLFGAVAAAEASLPAQIATELRDPTTALATTRLYVPLGVGNHVDHQLCFAAGLDLAASGWDVWFYEDIPYALKPNALAHRLDEIAASWQALAPAPLWAGRLEPVARIDIDAVWDTKVAAVLAYASQMQTIFREVVPDAAGTGIETALRAYASRFGDGFLAEQMWHITGLNRVKRAPEKEVAQTY